MEPTWICDVKYALVGMAYCVSRLRQICQYGVFVSLRQKKLNKILYLICLNYNLSLNIFSCT